MARRRGGGWPGSGAVQGGRGSWQSAGDGAARGGRQAGHIPWGAEEIAGIPPAARSRVRGTRSLQGGSGARASGLHAHSLPLPRELPLLHSALVPPLPHLGPQRPGETWREVQGSISADSAGQPGLMPVGLWLRPAS